MSLGHLGLPEGLDRTTEGLHLLGPTLDIWGQAPSALYQVLEGVLHEPALLSGGAPTLSPCTHDAAQGPLGLASQVGRGRAPTPGCGSQPCIHQP